jgi:hypothetical protein
MSGKMELSRRHGPFDTRWPPQSRTVNADGRAPVPAGLESSQDELEWEAFSTGCFPGHRRHDFEVVRAYEAYRRGRGSPKRSAGAQTTQSGGSAIGGTDEPVGAPARRASV